MFLSKNSCYYLLTKFSLKDLFLKKYLILAIFMKAYKILEFDTNDFNDYLEERAYQFITKELKLTDKIPTYRVNPGYHGRGQYHATFRGVYNYSKHLRDTIDSNRIPKEIQFYHVMTFKDYIEEILNTESLNGWSLEKIHEIRDKINPKQLMFVSLILSSEKSK